MICIVVIYFLIIDCANNFDSEIVHYFDTNVTIYSLIYNIVYDAKYHYMKNQDISQFFDTVLKRIIEIDGKIEDNVLCVLSNVFNNYKCDKEEFELVDLILNADISKLPPLMKVYHYYII